ncbi:MULTISPECIES: type II toxin-antitoxin system ParD family antitoxin [Rhizobium/Agrobacterium group]|uniref:Type II toxin-antitoxin system ParD family antitoxin n=1 Tax=Agrobacterium tumefaciens TaxID=358 RepID=A0AA44F1C8_AGRTU|nr:MULTISPECIES: type II toxin-antitoxin system ParD family antitoxin [Rhizobium/Agrobacterium group]NSL22687.1 type II toxin-antitoxin system ParD family antitoxin [Agrobacterium tumefaciens]NSY05846.1 type II toxin-antitoxin system ParD family antitoxin [Agrobacterium tumefaciens]NSZ05692.1 type II toxin-antitoxin system ParD family antitoxin [Agrobacterium tumefaciens]NTB84280.1 type II toxin-antitoxin system ParD family antitoxin [Agrobacterium tumefaciens]NTC15429.1 type II toxin-antitoxi
MPEIHLSEQDEKFIEEQVAAGVYSDADAVIHASLQLLSSDERKRVALKLLIQGIDDAEAGRVHRYASQDDFLSDIKRVSVQQKTGTCH